MESREFINIHQLWRLCSIYQRVMNVNSYRYNCIIRVIREINIQILFDEIVDMIFLDDEIDCMKYVMPIN